MIHRRAFFYFWVVGILSGAAVNGARAQSAAVSFQEIPETQSAVWDRSIKTFEKGVADQARDLAREDQTRTDLRASISALESKTTDLRNRASLNLFDQLRLKKLLNELQEKLRAESDLEHRLETSLSDFEQKSLSLLALYNQEISNQLGAVTDDGAGRHLDAVIEIVRKRQTLQHLIDRFPEVSQGEKMPPLSLLEKSGVRSAEDLSTTLDILRQREKRLRENVEKAEVREAEWNQEIALQSKMKDFLSDVRKMNEDSTVPRDSLNRGDLKTLEDQSEDSAFQTEIQTSEKQKEKDKKDLVQVGNYIQIIQSKLQALHQEASK